MVKFAPERHIRNVLGTASTALFRSDSEYLHGIVGKPGAGEVTSTGIRIGVDRIVLAPGSEFELHTHPGDHILYVLASRGFIHVDGKDFEMSAGDTVYVPAHYPHGVKTDPHVSEPLEILAFGVPHKPLESRERMALAIDTSSSRSDSGSPTNR